MKRSRTQNAGNDEEPAKVKAANAVSDAAIGEPLPQKAKEPAGNLVSYLFGAAAGGIYGVAAESSEVARACGGTLFGLMAIASHLVYGATTELVRRTLRSV